MTQPPTPLFDFKPATGTKGVLRLAAETTVAAKEAAGLLTEEHALTVALIFELATVVDRGFAFGGRTSVATTTLARELREAMASLPEPEAGAAGESWDAVVRDIA